MKLSDFLSDVGRPVAFYPSLVKALGSRNDAIFICQFAYWKDRGEDKNGWIYKTAEEIESETSLTYKEQVPVRKRLKKQGLLKEKFYRSEHRMYFRVAWDKVNKLWDTFSESEAPSQRSYATLPTVSSLNSNTYTTHIVYRKFKKNNNLHKNKKGVEMPDIVDGMLMVAKKIKDNEYLEKVSDYPEQHQKALLSFLSKWKLSPAVVPSRKNKSGYSRWIKGINSLVEISGEKRFDSVLDKAYKTWYDRAEEFRNVVDAPDKILPLFTSVDAGLRQTEQNKKDEFEKLTSVTEETDFASLEDMQKSLRRKNARNT